jgi:hypothetical protein
MDTSASAMPFSQVLEAVERLTVEEQEALTQVVRRRLAERGRKQVVRDVEEGRGEFAGGGCSSVTVDELIDEISS